MYKISKKKLSVAMLRAGVESAKHLAELSGVSPNTISRLNNGSTAKLSTVRLLAGSLGVDPAEIIEEGGNKP